jgi:hypothetical protein
VFLMWMLARFIGCWHGLSFWFGGVYVLLALASRDRLFTVGMAFSLEAFKLLLQKREMTDSASIDYYSHLLGRLLPSLFH